MILLQAAAATSPFDPIFLLLMIGVFLVVNFLFIRPKQKKKEQEQVDFIGNLPVGAPVVTMGGIHGKVYKNDDAKTILVEVSAGVKLKIEKVSISYDMTKALNNSTPEVK